MKIKHLLFGLLVFFVSITTVSALDYAKASSINEDVPQNILEMIEDDDIKILEIKEEISPSATLTKYWISIEHFFHPTAPKIFYYTNVIYNTRMGGYLDLVGPVGDKGGNFYRYEGYLYNLNNNVPLLSINQELKGSTAIIQADTIEGQTIYTASDIYLLPKSLWYRSGEYAGYVYKTEVWNDKNGIWYGKYKGTLRKGAFESNFIPETEI